MKGLSYLFYTAVVILFGPMTAGAQPYCGPTTQPSEKKPADTVKFFASFEEPSQPPLQPKNNVEAQTPQTLPTTQNSAAAAADALRQFTEKATHLTPEEIKQIANLCFENYWVERFPKEKQDEIKKRYEEANKRFGSVPTPSGHVRYLDLVSQILYHFERWESSGFEAATSLEKVPDFKLSNDLGLAKELGVLDLSTGKLRDANLGLRQVVIGDMLSKIATKDPKQIQETVLRFLQINSVVTAFYNVATKLVQDVPVAADAKAFEVVSRKFWDGVRDTRKPFSASGLTMQQMQYFNSLVSRIIWESQQAVAEQAKQGTSESSDGAAEISDAAIQTQIFAKLGINLKNLYEDSRLSNPEKMEMINQRLGEIGLVGVVAALESLAVDFNIPTSSDNETFYHAKISDILLSQFIVDSPFYHSSILRIGRGVGLEREFDWKKYYENLGHYPGAIKYYEEKHLGPIVERTDAFLTSIASVSLTGLDANPHFREAETWDRETKTFIAYILETIPGFTIAKADSSFYSKDELNDLVRQVHHFQQEVAYHFKKPLQIHFDSLATFQSQSGELLESFRKTEQIAPGVQFEDLGFALSASYRIAFPAKDYKPSTFTEVLELTRPLASQADEVKADKKSFAQTESSNAERILSSIGFWRGEIEEMSAPMMLASNKIFQDRLESRRNELAQQVTENGKNHQIFAVSPLANHVGATTQPATRPTVEGPQTRPTTQRALQTNAPQWNLLQLEAFKASLDRWGLDQRGIPSASQKETLSLGEFAKGFTPSSLKGTSRLLETTRTAVSRDIIVSFLLKDNWKTSFSKTIQLKAEGDHPFFQFLMTDYFMAPMQEVIEEAIRYQIELGRTYKTLAPSGEFLAPEIVRMEQLKNQLKNLFIKAHILSGDPSEVASNEKRMQEVMGEIGQYAQKQIAEDFNLAQKLKKQTEAQHSVVDLNHASLQDLMFQIGVSEKVGSLIIAARPIKDVADVAKLMEPNDFQRGKQWMYVEGAAIPFDKLKKELEAMKLRSTQHVTYMQKNLLDLNQASQVDIEQKTGLSSSEARLLVSKRPFKNILEIENLLSKTAFDKIKNKARVGGFGVDKVATETGAYIGETKDANKNPLSAPEVERLVFVEEYTASAAGAVFKSGIRSHEDFTRLTFADAKNKTLGNNASEFQKWFASAKIRELEEVRKNQKPANSLNIYSREMISYMGLPWTAALDRQLSQKNYKEFRAMFDKLSQTYFENGRDLFESFKKADLQIEQHANVRGLTQAEVHRIVQYASRHPDYLAKLVTVSKDVRINSKIPILEVKDLLVTAGLNDLLGKPKTTTDRFGEVKQYNLDGLVYEGGLGDMQTIAEQLSSLRNFLSISQRFFGPSENEESFADMFAEILGIELLDQVFSFQGFSYTDSEVEKARQNFASALDLASEEEIESRLSKIYNNLPSDSLVLVKKPLDFKQLARAMSKLQAAGKFNFDAFTSQLEAYIRAQAFQSVQLNRGPEVAIDLRTQSLAKTRTPINKFLVENKSGEFFKGLESVLHDGSVTGRGKSRSLNTSALQTQLANLTADHPLRGIGALEAISQLVQLQLRKRSLTLEHGQFDSLSPDARKEILHLFDVEIARQRSVIATSSSRNVPSSRPSITTPVYGPDFNLQLVSDLNSLLDVLQDPKTFAHFVDLPSVSKANQQLMTMLTNLHSDPLYAFRQQSLSTEISFRPELPVFGSSLRGSFGENGVPSNWFDGQDPNLTLGQGEVRGSLAGLLDSELLPAELRRLPEMTQLLQLAVGNGDGKRWESLTQKSDWQKAFLSPHRNLTDAAIASFALEMKPEVYVRTSLEGFAQLLLIGKNNPWGQEIGPGVDSSQKQIRSHLDSLVHKFSQAQRDREVDYDKLIHNLYLIIASRMEIQVNPALLKEGTTAEGHDFFSGISKMAKMFTAKELSPREVIEKNIVDRLTFINEEVFRGSPLKKDPEVQRFLNLLSSQDSYSHFTVENKDALLKLFGGAAFSKLADNFKEESKNLRERNIGYLAAVAGSFSKKGSMLDGSTDPEFTQKKHQSELERLLQFVWSDPTSAYRLPDKNGFDRTTDLPQDLILSHLWGIKYEQAIAKIDEEVQKEGPVTKLPSAEIQAAARELADSVRELESVSDWNNAPKNSQQLHPESLTEILKLAIKDPSVFPKWATQAEVRNPKFSDDDARKIFTAYLKGSRYYQEGAPSYSKGITATEASTNILVNDSKAREQIDVLVRVYRSMQRLVDLQWGVNGGKAGLYSTYLSAERKKNEAILRLGTMLKSYAEVSKDYGYSPQELNKALRNKHLNFAEQNKAVFEHIMQTIDLTENPHWNVTKAAVTGPAHLMGGAAVGLFEPFYHVFFERPYWNYYSTGDMGVGGKDSPAVALERLQKMKLAGIDLGSISGFSPELLEKGNEANLYTTWFLDVLSITLIGTGSLRPGGYLNEGTISARNLGARFGNLLNKATGERYFNPGGWFGRALRLETDKASTQFVLSEHGLNVEERLASRETARANRAKARAAEFPVTLPESRRLPYYPEGAREPLQVAGAKSVPAHQQASAIADAGAARQTVSPAMKAKAAAYYTIEKTLRFYEQKMDVYDAKMARLMEDQVVKAQNIAFLKKAEELGLMRSSLTAKLKQLGQQAFHIAFDTGVFSTGQMAIQRNVENDQDKSQFEKDLDRERTIASNLMFFILMGAHGRATNLLATEAKIPKWVWGSGGMNRALQFAGPLTRPLGIAGNRFLGQGVMLYMARQGAEDGVKMLNNVDFAKTWQRSSLLHFDFNPSSKDESLWANLPRDKNGAPIFPDGPAGQDAQRKYNQWKQVRGGFYNNTFLFGYMVGKWGASKVPDKVLDLRPSLVNSQNFGRLKNAWEWVLPNQKRAMQQLASPEMIRDRVRYWVSAGVNPEVFAQLKYDIMASQEELDGQLPKEPGPRTMSPASSRMMRNVEAQLGVIKPSLGTSDRQAIANFFEKYFDQGVKEGLEIREHLFKDNQDIANLRQTLDQLETNASKGSSPAATHAANLKLLGESGLSGVISLTDAGDYANQAIRGQLRAKELGVNFPSTPIVGDLISSDLTLTQWKNLTRDSEAGLSARYEHLSRSASKGDGMVELMAIKSGNHILGLEERKNNMEGDVEARLYMPTMGVAFKFIRTGEGAIESMVEDGSYNLRFFDPVKQRILSIDTDADGNFKELRYREASGRRLITNKLMEGEAPQLLKSLGITLEQRDQIPAAEFQRNPRMGGEPIVFNPAGSDITETQGKMVKVKGSSNEQWTLERNYRQGAIIETITPTRFDPDAGEMEYSVKIRIAKNPKPKIGPSYYEIELPPTTNKSQAYWIDPVSKKVILFGITTPMQFVIDAELQTGYRQDPSGAKIGSVLTLAEAAKLMKQVRKSDPLLYPTDEETAKVLSQTYYKDKILRGIYGGDYEAILKAVEIDQRVDVNEAAKQLDLDLNELVKPTQKKSSSELVDDAFRTMLKRKGVPYPHLARADLSSDPARDLKKKEIEELNLLVETSLAQKIEGVEGLLTARSRLLSHLSFLEACQKLNIDPEGLTKSIWSAEKMRMLEGATKAALDSLDPTDPKIDEKQLEVLQAERTLHPMANELTLRTALLTLKPDLNDIPLSEHPVIMGAKVLDVAKSKTALEKQEHYDTAVAEAKKRGLTVLTPEEARNENFQRRLKAWQGIYTLLVENGDLLALRSPHVKGEIQQLLKTEMFFSRRRFHPDSAKVKEGSNERFNQVEASADFLNELIGTKVAPLEKR